MAMRIKIIKVFPLWVFVAHDQDWEKQGLWTVHMDFEGACLVTGFRLRAKDAGSVCFTLREDDEDAEVLKSHYQNKD